MVMEMSFSEVLVCRSFLLFLIFEDFIFGNGQFFLLSFGDDKEADFGPCWAG